MIRKCPYFIECRFIGWNFLMNITNRNIFIDFCKNDWNWFKHLIWNFLEIDETLKEKFENGICLFDIIAKSIWIKNKNEFHVFDFRKYSIMKIGIRKYSVDTKRIQLTRIINHKQCILIDFDWSLKLVRDLSFRLHFLTYFSIA